MVPTCGGAKKLVVGEGVIGLGLGMLINPRRQRRRVGRISQATLARERTLQRTFAVRRMRLVRDYSATGETKGKTGKTGKGQQRSCMATNQKREISRLDRDNPTALPRIRIRRKEIRPWECCPVPGNLPISVRCAICLPARWSCGGIRPSSVTRKALQYDVGSNARASENESESYRSKQILRCRKVFWPGKSAALPASVPEGVRDNTSAMLRLGLPGQAGRQIDRLLSGVGVPIPGFRAY